MVRLSVCAAGSRKTFCETMCGETDTVQVAWKSCQSTPASESSGSEPTAFVAATGASYNVNAPVTLTVVCPATSPTGVAALSIAVMRIL